MRDFPDDGVFFRVFFFCSKIINLLFKGLAYNTREHFAHFKSRLSSIVRVNVVLNRTVVVDSDWRFLNPCGSHLQSQSELYHVSWYNGRDTINWRDTTHLDYEDDYRTGCRNVSHCQQQQSYSGLRSPGRSNSAYFEMTPGFKPFTISLIVNVILTDGIRMFSEYSYQKIGANCKITVFFQWTNKPLIRWFSI